MVHLAGAKLPLYTFGIKRALGSNKRAHTGSDDHCVPVDIGNSDNSDNESYFLDELLLAKV